MKERMDYEKMRCAVFFQPEEFNYKMSTRTGTGNWLISNKSRWHCQGMEMPDTEADAETPSRD
jgi:hypothetical protein